MKLKFFRVLALDPAEAESELNAFCSSHRVANIEKQFVLDGNNSFWAICVAWLDNEGSLLGVTKRKNRIDYKEVLNEEDFSVYSKLRELRKRMAEQEATPPYNIFTNEQLANMVRQRIVSKSDLLKLEGIGEKRVEKYADAFLQSLKGNFKFE